MAQQWGGGSDAGSSSAVVDIPASNAAAEEGATQWGADVLTPEEVAQLPPIVTSSNGESSSSAVTNDISEAVVSISPEVDSHRLPSLPPPYRHWLSRWRGRHEPTAPAEAEGETQSSPATPLLADVAGDAAVGESSLGGSQVGGSVIGTTGSLTRYVSRLSESLSRSKSSASVGAQGSCLICLEPFTAEDYESGEAITLDCECRGEVAMRHYACAVKWIKIKGDLVCEVCKAEVKNLPAPTPPASESDGESVQGRPSTFGGPYSPWRNHPSYGEGPEDQMDGVYDCLKVVWIVMILCVLFFDLPFYQSVWAGVIVGVVYTFVMRLNHLLQRAALRYQLEAQTSQESPISR